MSQLAELAAALVRIDSVNPDLVPGGARDNTFAGRRRAGGLDTQLHLGPFDFWAEGLRERFEPADALPARRLDAEGWYVQAAWFALPKTLQAVLKYDVYDPNLDAASDRTRTWTAGANYFIKGDDLKLQLDYLLTAIDGPTPENRKLLLRLQTLF